MLKKAKDMVFYRHHLGEIDVLVPCPILSDDQKQINVNIYGPDNPYGSHQLIYLRGFGVFTSSTMDTITVNDAVDQHNKKELE